MECETSEFDGCRLGRAMDVVGIADGFSNFITYPRPSQRPTPGLIIYDISFSAMHVTLFSGPDVKVDKKYAKKKVSKTTQDPYMPTRAQRKMFSKNDAKSPKKKHV